MVAIVRVDTTEIERAMRRLGGQGRQIRYATAVALTASARSAQSRIAEQIERTFDRPTPWIKKGTFVERATKDNLLATVGIKDQGRVTQHHYLREHVTGGARGAKPYELALRSLGILPAGWLTVPVPGGVKLDSYGNISKTTLGRIITGVQTRAAVQTGAGTFRLFVARPGDPRTAHLAPGIWSSARTAAGVQMQPVLLFVRAARYTERLDLHNIVSQAVADSFSTEFASALERALETAR